MSDYTVKREAAINWLGPRWVFDRAQYVKRIPAAQQISMHRCDVEATFRRVRARLDADRSLIVSAT